MAVEKEEVAPQHLRTKEIINIFLQISNRVAGAINRSCEGSCDRIEIETLAVPLLDFNILPGLLHFARTTTEVNIKT